MRFVRAKHVLVTVTAMLSLFVSAVSACACSHHKPVKQTAESSCHGPSHMVPAAEPSNLLGTHLESACNCFVQTRIPAIVAKKDDKRTTVQAPVGDVQQLPVFLAAEFDRTNESEPSFEPPQSNYHHALLASLPSRAPPRL